MTFILAVSITNRLWKQSFSQAVHIRKPLMKMKSFLFLAILFMRALYARSSAQSLHKLFVSSLLASARAQSHQLLGAGTSKCPWMHLRWVWVTRLVPISQRNAWICPQVVSWCNINKGITEDSVWTKRGNYHWLKSFRKLRNCLCSEPPRGGWGLELERARMVKEIKIKLFENSRIPR